MAPPAMSTSPVCRRVAVCPTRCESMKGAGEKVPLAGSKTSPVRSLTPAVAVQVAAVAWQYAKLYHGDFSRDNFLAFYSGHVDRGPEDIP